LLILNAIDVTNNPNSWQNTWKADKKEEQPNSI
jgi:hypothetical protein